MTRRVVITGMAGLSPIGNDWPTIKRRLLAKRTGIQILPSLGEIKGMRTRLGAPVANFERPGHYGRKKVRTMGRVSLMATRATELALERAGLLGHPALEDGRTGIAYGSTSGSPTAMEHYSRHITVDRSLSGVTAVTYIKMMSHTCPANLSQFFGIKGRMIPTCSACTAGSQGIGYAYETIKFGQHEVMVAGGAEELHAIETAVFDVMYATSTQNEAPHRQPRPFDRDRDGLVIGEGAATLVLESLEHAQARGASILGEILGFGTNCDGTHVVNPSVAGMCAVMRLALDDAGLSPDEVDYVNAHGTATAVGDTNESHATREIFGRPVPISSLKSYMGHTLGACGALEAWLCLEMMNEGWLAPTANLETVDPDCAELDYLTEVRPTAAHKIMSNNFAFGGVNTTLILAKWRDEKIRSGS